MHKRWKGYFSIEASLIMPIILFLYLLIILAALYMYCRCAISQDTFLLGMRAGCFSYGEDNYGEVIYGEEKGWYPEGYVQERLNSQKQTYPLYSYVSGSCIVSEDSISIKTVYRERKEPLVKCIQKYNPVRIICEGRKNRDVRNEIL